MIGQTVSHYRILEKLGAGGMGEVFLADDTRLHRRVALKFLPSAVASDPEARERLLREARAASRLHHPNIVTIHSIEEESGQYFIVMEHVEGVPLSHWVLQERPDPERLVSVFQETCKGLQHAHSAGIVHRDLKPDNILVEKDGRVRILDFGVARQSGTPRLTQTGSMIGTMAYVSPEQVQGKEASFQSDLFSLGVVMYELLSGQKPFAGEHEAAVLYSIAHEEPKPLRSLNARVSADLERVVTRCLAKSPAARFASAEDLQRALATGSGKTESAFRPPETAYAKSGSTHIAYQVFGEGAIDLVLVHGWVSHVELIWQHSLAADFLRKLGSRFRVIMFDKRGTGLSDRVTELPTLEQRMDDVRAVMDAAASRRAMVMGISEGGPMCALFAATYPERALCLVMYGSYPLRIRDSEFPWAPTREEREAYSKAVERDWGGPVDLDTLAPSLRNDPEYSRWLSMYCRQSASPGAAAALIRMNSQVDIRSILTTIRVPALVMHRIGDGDSSVEGSRYMAARIPGAQFVELPGADHIPWVGDSESVLNALYRFTDELAPSEPVDTVLLTALCLKLDDDTSPQQANSLSAGAFREFPPRFVRSDAGGLVALFEGPIRALRAARRLAEQADTAGHSWRIALHTGECDASFTRAAGTAVTVADHVAAQGGTGRILLTSTVRDLVAGSDLKFEEVGETRVAGLDHAWRILSLLVPGQRPPGRPSIAVLPFVNMSADPENEYFSDGLAEELINALSKIKELRVVARTSAFSFKGKDTDVREIGRRLDVKTLLEGSVRTSGKKLRVTAQLVECDDGDHLWSERFDRELHDVFEIQDEITHAIVDSLKLRLLPGTESAISKRQTENAEALALYMKGRYFWSTRTERGLLQGIECFDQATSLDPRYAPAHVGLADCYSLLCAYHIKSPQESLPRALEAATTAMKLDPTLAEAWEAIAHVRLLDDWNWKAAEHEYRRALELNPGYATAHQRLALLLGITGRLDEAAGQIARARELEPLSLIIQTDQALISYLSRDFESALTQCKATLDMDPNFGVAHFVHGLALEQLTQYDDAVTAFHLARNNTGGIAVTLGALGHAHARAGLTDEARLVLEESRELAGRRYVSPYSLATIHLGLGETDLALDCLEQAVREKSVWLIHLHLKVDPRLDPLRSHPRFQAVLKAAGF